MDNLIDLHCHLLWGVDDGPSTVKEATDMLEILILLGFSKVVATPHIKMPDQNQTRIIDTFTEARENFNNPHLFLGAEYMLTDDIIVHDRPLLRLGGGDHILVELSWQNQSIRLIKRLIFELQSKGYSILLAHPERSLVTAPFNFFFDLVERGVKLQADLLSLVGIHGRRSRKLLRRLLKEDLIFAMATDMHAYNARYEDFEKAIETLIDLTGERASLYLRENPQRLLGDTDCT